MVKIGRLEFPVKRSVRILAVLAFNWILRIKLQVSKKIHHIDHPVVYLYATCWNEEMILPYMFNHYDRIVDKFFIYDNHSTDSSAELIRSNRKAEIREYAPEKIDDDALRNFKNQCWKEARGKADFVIVCDIDEFLFHPDLEGSVSRLSKGAYSICHPQGYEMCSENFPAYKTGMMLTDSVKDGVKSEFYSKCVLFDPHRIVDINYVHGAHKCKPVGIVYEYDDSDLKLLHYKYLGLDNVISRYGLMSRRLSENNLWNGLGKHYTRNVSQITEVFDSLKRNSTRII